MPGETFQTLKQKSIQQAKKSGMSQSAAENYGSAMATQSAVQGGGSASSDFMGASQEQKNKTLKEIMSNVGAEVIPPSITDFSETATQNVQQLAEERKKAAQEMKDKGGVYNPQTGEVEYPKKTKLFEGLGSLDDISGIKGIFTGPEIQRLTPAQLGRAKKIIANYQKLGIKNPLKLRSIMANNIGGWLSGKDQTFSDMEGNRVNPDELLFEGDKIFHLNKDGQKVEVRRTREGTIDLLKEEIGSEGIQSLKKFNPELYYPFKGMPQTTDELENLARLDTKGLEGTNPDLVKMIFNARDELDRQKGERTRYTGLGSFMGEEPWVGDRSADEFAQQVSYGAVPTPGIPTPGIPTPGIPTPGIPSLAPTSIDYASMAPQFGPQYPGYLNQGLMNPNFSPYYDNLRNYYGIG